MRFSKEPVIAKQQNTMAKKIREQEAKRKSEEKRVKRMMRQDQRLAKQQPECPE